MNENFTLIIAVIGLLLTAGGVVGAVYALVERKITPLQKTADETAKAVGELRVGVIGLDGNNGLRSDVRELQADVKVLRKELVDVRIAAAEHEH